jgi:hypothetical protein
MITFDASHLKHLLPFVSQSDTRFYLKALHIAPHEDGGAVLVACNGHTMMCVRDITAVCAAPANLDVRKEAAAYGARRNRGASSLCTVDQASGRLTITAALTGDELYLQPGNCILESKTADGRPFGYVDWKSVLPAFDKLQPGAADAINTKYHELAAKAHPVARQFGPAIRFWQTGPRATLAVEFCDAPEYLLLIMPLVSKQSDTAAKDIWPKAFRKNPKPVVATTPAAKEVVAA